MLSYLKELGVYEEIKPGLLAYDSDLSEAFKEEIKEIFSSNEARKNIYNPEKLTNRRKIKLHKNKLENILDFLKENKIVVENETDIWFDMDRNDADIFMSILAKYLAKIYSKEKKYVDIRNRYFKGFFKTISFG